MPEIIRKWVFLRNSWSTDWRRKKMLITKFHFRSPMELCPLWMITILMKNVQFEWNYIKALYRIHFILTWTKNSFYPIVSSWMRSSILGTHSRYLNVNLKFASQFSHFQSIRIELDASANDALNVYWIVKQINCWFEFQFRLHWNLFNRREWTRKKREQKKKMTTKKFA